MGVSNNISESEVKSQFKSYLESLDLVIDGFPIMDGRKHRVPVSDDSSGKKSGEYRGYLDGWPAGYGRNYKREVSPTWKFELGNDVGDISYKFIPLKKKNYNSEELKNDEDLRGKSYSLLKYLLSKLPVAKSNYSYLVRKKIPSDHKIYYNERYNNLLLPIYSLDDKLQSGQWISDTDKKFFSSLPVSGGACLVGGSPKNTINNYVKKRSLLYFAEGFATAKTVSMCIREPVLNLYSAHNFKIVCELLDGMNLNSSWVFFCDNDHNKVLNTGRKIGEEIKERFDSVNVLLPDGDGFSGSDWNDYYVQFGLRKTQDVIGGLLKKINNDCNIDFGML